MLVTREISKSGDPSAEIQSFKKLNINVLCCRYWWFEVWKGENMSFPYWRLYWNRNSGAYVQYDSKTNLEPDKIYLIPPQTSFSNGIENQKFSDSSEYFFKCGRIESKRHEEERSASGHILHFFVHFTLGIPYDHYAPGVFEVSLNEERRNLLSQIVTNIYEAKDSFSIEQSLRLYRLILNSVSQLEVKHWSKNKVDERIASILTFMEANLHQKLTSEVLANQLYLSPSAFLRLFRKNMGVSPSKFFTKLRIDHACNLLSHTNKSMESIAMDCGFTDRYHLTKVFSKTKKTSPAAFRKKVGYY